MCILIVGSPLGQNVGQDGNPLDADCGVQTCGLLAQGYIRGTPVMMSEGQLYACRSESNREAP